MGKIIFTKGTGVPKTSFSEDFLTHRRTSEWWYSTGYLHDADGKMFSYQYTLARVLVYGIRFHMMLTNVTDFEKKKHYHSQQIAFFNKGVTTTESLTRFGNTASVRYSANEIDPKGKMDLFMKGSAFELNLQLNATKPPVWNCEDGKLQMGILSDPKQVSYYYSYTNLQSKGIMVLDGVTHEVTGKSWFDKQGGTYQIYNSRTNWEWFSLRFFDDEEVMLFSFPQNGHKDGTFIKKDGSYQRLNQFEIKPHQFIQESGYRFSDTWDLSIPGRKEETYFVKPITNGQFNVAFFESLAEIKNKNDVVVGYAVVELLPGAYNTKLQNWRAFKRT